MGDALHLKRSSVISVGLSRQTGHPGALREFSAAVHATKAGQSRCQVAAGSWLQGKHAWNAE